MSDVPQFATAEYSRKSGETLCNSCQQRISGAYYLLNGAPACASCVERIREQMPRDSHKSFVRGVLFGVAGAILGLVIYVAFALATGWMVGYVSLAVGYIVGKAISLGSRGVGGRRYQVAAVLLTYVAVSLAAVPIAISVHKQHRVVQQQPAQAEDQPPAQAGDQPPTQVNGSAAAPPTRMSPARAVGLLALLGLASPLLALAHPAQGLIGLIILLVGIQIAWKITAARQLNISGPIAEPVAGTPG